MPIKKDEEVLKNNCPHIVVGTPGRTLALVRSGALKLNKVKYFVLDECDKMIGDLGVFDLCPVIHVLSLYIVVKDWGLRPFISS